MNINDMTRKDFEALPHRKWNEEIICDNIIILPTKRKHDSGYRCMDFVAVTKNEPICLLSGCSDVVHIDGIGGFGYKWVDKYRRIPPTVPVSGWSVDCLPKSGLLRMWPHKKRIKCGAALSSFEIFAVSEK